MSFNELIEAISSYHTNKIKIIEILNELINEYLEK
jgi:hypothetical protein